jgi:deoxyribonuclease-4
MALKSDNLRFGTAGIPHSAPKGTPTNGGIELVRKLGLDAMELEFVHSVFLNEAKAKSAGEIAKKNNIFLTAHAPYYVNLNAAEKEKVEASKKRIVDSARALNFAQGYSCTFHPGYYLKDDPEAVFERMRVQFKDIMRILDDEGINDVWIRPETTGKPTQFGNLNELLKLSSEFERIMPCIDFAHLHARSNGKFNTTKEFREVLELVEKHLGKRGLDNMHVHFSGIEYSEKGERNHLFLKDSDFNYKDWIRVIRDFKVKGVFICESPNIEDDALMIKKLYEAK